MPFADIELRDNGLGFDIALSSGTPGPTGNRNFFMFFDEISILLVVAVPIFLP